jgi:hypothetical protein
VSFGFLSLPPGTEFEYYRDLTLRLIYSRKTFAMAKLKFGAWIPTYAWSGGKSDTKNVKRIRASIEKCEDQGIDVWVVDHLLSAPGLYGNACWSRSIRSPSRLR